MISREKIKQALIDAEEFKRTFKKVIDVQYAGKKYVDQVTPLISYILTHPEEFDRLINDRSSFVYLAEQLPKASDAIILFVIRHPKEFARLITSKIDLEVCAKSPVFKNYAGIFKQPTLELANYSLRVINSNHEIRQAARYLWLGLRDSGSTLNVLLPELIIKFASYMRDATVHSESYAVKAALKHYGKPPIKKDI